MEKDIDCLEEEQMSNDMKPNQSDDQPCIIENYQDVHHDLGNNDNIQSINNNEIHQIDVDQLQPCIEDYQDQDASVDNGNNNIDNNNIVDDHHPVLVGGSYSGGKSNSSNISIGSGNGSSSSSSDGVIDPPDNNSLVDLQKSTNLFNTTSVSLAEELSEQQFRFDNQKKLHDSIDLEVGGGKKQLNYSINNNNNNNNNGAGRESESDFQLRQYFENSQRMALSNGNKPKKMGISVTDLTVVGKGADISIIEDLFTPIKFIFNPFKWKRNNGTTFNILNNINMFCRDGEMVLVLGRPGAGCSTLLRVIANQRDTYVNVGGKVSYGGLDSKEWASKYRGEAIYVPEEDSHYPTLTLKQTIDFALKCKTPGNRVPYDAKRTFRQKVYDLLANITASNSNPYTTSFLTQVRALTLRQAQLIWGDRPALASRYISVLVQSFVYGSLFYLQKHDLSGLFTRGGAIFGSILFNAFLSQGELTATFVGRRALQKQKSYAMYRPSAFHIAQVLNDIPVVFAQVVLYSVIAYFMFGFQYGVSQFIIWIVVMVGLTLGICNFFRALGFFSPSLYVSQHVMVVYLLLLLCYTGYSVPYQKMHPWLQWFFWFNPLSYGYKALMANEFKDVLFECYQTAIPYGAYNDPRYRTCAIPGATPGILQVSGEAYLQAGYSFRADDISYNTVIVYIWWISLTILNMFAIEFFDWTKGGYTKKVYKQGKAPKINDLEEEKSQAKIVKEANENVGKTLEFHGGVFSWKNIKYTVPVKGEKRLILDDVEGWIRPGQMTALVGSTGAGKTTLLDVLAKRKTIGALSGDIRLNGRPLGIDFERITGYVEQMDIFNPNLTVREALRFSAKLRQDPHVPLEEKFEYVERVLEMMEMKHLGDALVGCLESGVGISIEERKRLNIGIELVAKPHILFLDEPTSGLDSQSSYNIIKFIRKLADSGMPLVCTIHQPSSVLFEYFDRLLLLAKGGKTVYFGDIGHRSSTLINYFTRHGIRPCLESENPAEYILEATGAGFHGNKSNGHGREYASRYYGCMSFTVAMVSVQLPYLIFTSSLFYICTFWLAGFGFEVVMNLYFWAYFVIFLFFCVSLGQAIGAICETMFLANFVVPVILVFLFLFSGVMIPESQIPRFWREWVYRVMPTRYFMEGVVTTILKDVNIKCTTADLVKFHSPEGSTCEEYTWLFSMYSTGYVQQLDSSPNDCGYCLYSTGEEFYSTLGWKDSNRLRNLIIVSCYWLFNVFLIGIFVYISRKPKR
ncbi:ABC transporter G family protein [Cavenderia fasciculata]|uniref:ABC transporter G family protein n=1 Tax=Cavenderia fasciculata TaxID=261658 RepID=F4PJ35_CACFS|nr:ABC transporter G family protein [Cavenderia fasciculata]EGG24321.1 ABC transporter G family protein [Cavenderia fasciculata]|eukprot:XP_004362172.1 ABC transporter G family protein [Cavenderia fasciculata]